MSCSNEAADFFLFFSSLPYYPWWYLGRRASIAEFLEEEEEEGRELSYTPTPAFAFRLEKQRRTNCRIYTDGPFFYFILERDVFVVQRAGACSS